MVNICVFAGAARGHDSELPQLAYKIGVLTAARHIGLIYGGGRTGIMGALAEGALSKDGYVHGIIPEFLENLEISHSGCTKLTIARDMHERKAIMYNEADAFLALPGGFGTMEEMMEIITWRQLGTHNKPIYLFNHQKYWQSMLNMWDDARDAGFIKPHQLDLFTCLDDLDQTADAFDKLAKKP